MLLASLGAGVNLPSHPSITSTSLFCTFCFGTHSEVGRTQPVLNSLAILIEFSRAFLAGWSYLPFDYPTGGSLGIP